MRELTEDQAVGNDKFVIHYAHSLKTMYGDIVIFESVPTHKTEEACKACFTGEALAAMTGLENNGPFPVKVLKEDPTFMFAFGFPAKETPLGSMMVVAGPAMEKAKARMLAEGKKLPDPDSEQDQQEAWEQYVAEQKAMEAEASLLDALLPHTTMQ